MASGFVVVFVYLNLHIIIPDSFISNNFSLKKTKKKHENQMKAPVNKSVVLRLKIPRELICLFNALHFVEFLFFPYKHLELFWDQSVYLVFFF